LKRKGFTIVELVMTIVVLGMIIAIALPKLRQAWLNFNVRSARLAFDAVAERARTAAVHRGCVSTLNITTGSAGAVWVTACPVSGSATSDTVGAIEPLATRYGVTMTPSRSSLQYDPRGVSVGNLSVTVVFTGAGSRTDSAMINQLGKVVR
jgi:prepilin-type N-terminal cleavage/methylation domain-containing protein